MELKLQSCNDHFFQRFDLIWLYFFQIKSSDLIWFKLELFANEDDLIWLYVYGKSNQGIRFDLILKHHNLTKIICDLREIHQTIYNTWI